LGCLTTNHTQDEVEQWPIGFAGTASTTTGREHPPSLGRGQAANFVYHSGFPYSWLPRDEEQVVLLSGKIALTTGPCGGTSNKGRTEKTIAVMGK
jgi:hypothetical protein